MNQLRQTEASIAQPDHLPKTDRITLTPARPTVKITPATVDTVISNSMIQSNLLQTSQSSRETSFVTRDKTKPVVLSISSTKPEPDENKVNVNGVSTKSGQSFPVTNAKTEPVASTTSLSTISSACREKKLPEDTTRVPTYEVTRNKFSFGDYESQCRALNKTLPLQLEKMGIGAEEVFRAAMMSSGKKKTVLFFQVSGRWILRDRRWLSVVLA